MAISTQRAASSHDRQSRQSLEPPVAVLDVRTERSFRDDGGIGQGAIRMPPDEAVRLAREHGLDPGVTLALYCT